jgi:hypothetical protein
MARYRAGGVRSFGATNLMPNAQRETYRFG